MPAQDPRRRRTILACRKLPSGFVVLGRDDVVMGRATSCFIPLLGEGVSRRHARIFWDGQAYTVEDLGSTNGTQVNGESLKGPRRLADQDMIKVGSFDLKVVFTEATREELAQRYAPQEAKTWEDGDFDKAVKGDDVPLAGRFDDTVLLEVCQLIELSERSGEMSVDLGARIKGSLIFSAGIVVDARLGDDAGEQAVRKIVSARRGTYSFAQDPPDAPKRSGPLAIKTSSMVPDVMRWRDEEKRDLRNRKTTQRMARFDETTVEDVPDDEEGPKTHKLPRSFEIVEQSRRLRQELAAASRVQRKLLPPPTEQLPGLEVSGKTIPAGEIGGDVLDFFVRRSPAWGAGGKHAAQADGTVPRDMIIAIGDVSGKGAGAGMVMATVRATLRAGSEREASTTGLAYALNRGLVGCLETGTFLSLLLLRWSVSDRVLTYTGAGHEHLLVLRAQTGRVQAIRSGGLVLGIMADVQGKLDERKLDLQPDDLVLLYTDGATEARSPGGEELGLERLARVFQEAAPKRTAAGVCDHVIARVRAWEGEGNQSDDVTILVLRATGA